MTAYEAKIRYGDKDNGYVSCMDCPILVEKRHEICGGDGSGFSTCWKHIAKWMTDNVNHPSHYNQGKFECIDVMVETFGKEVTQHFCLLNSFKYIWRTGEKNGIEDIKKAAWYLDKYIELDGEGNE